MNCVNYYSVIQVRSEKNYLKCIKEKKKKLYNKLKFGITFIVLQPDFPFHVGYFMKVG